jgi:hypothetical protein
MPSAIHKSNQPTRPFATIAGGAARQRALVLADLASAESDPERRRELEQSALRAWQSARQFSRMRIERRFIACDQCNGAGWFVGRNGQLHTCVACEGAGECRR